MDLVSPSADCDLRIWGGGNTAGSAGTLAAGYWLDGTRD